MIFMRQHRVSFVDHENSTLCSTHCLDSIFARATHVTVYQITSSGVLKPIRWEQIQLLKHSSKPFAHSCFPRTWWAQEQHMAICQQLMSSITLIVRNTTHGLIRMQHGRYMLNVFQVRKNFSGLLKAGDLAIKVFFNQ